MIDLDQLRAVLAAPPQHPEILGDAVLVSRSFLQAVADELSARRATDGAGAKA